MSVAIVLIVIGLYWVPTILAASNRKANVGAICALNFFLGWTLIGWVIALVWALTVDPRRV
jgi:Superinfection immunity protein